MKDDVLMSRVAQGDESALERLYEQYSTQVYSLALRIVGDAGAAEEILQDVFLTLWRKASQFNSLAGSLTGWLMAVTRHRAISDLRKQSRQLYANSFVETFDYPAHIALRADFRQKETAREMATIALTALPESYREVIALAYFEGMTCEEISVRTSTALGTTKTRIRSALRAMKKCLSNHGLTEPGQWSRPGTNLQDVLTTYQLASRPCRERNPKQQRDSVRSLTRTAAASRKDLLDVFLKMSIDLCSAGTAGLSMLETTESGAQIFRWTNLAGKLEKYTGGSTPRRFSPCGVTVDRECPQLFYHPGRYFHYFNDVDIPIVEGLVVPFFVGGEIQGTVWIVSHSESRRFDSEDVRIMTTLADLTGALCTGPV